MEITIDYTRHIGPDFTPDAGTKTFTPSTEPPDDTDHSLLEEWAQLPGNLCDQVDGGGDQGITGNTARITACAERPDLVGQFLEWAE